jgi:hypothetical protein
VWLVAVISTDKTELWSEESPAGPLVALAEVADAAGAALAWDDAAHQASLRTPLLRSYSIPRPAWYEARKESH